MLVLRVLEIVYQCLWHDMLKSGVRIRSPQPGNIDTLIPLLDLCSHILQEINILRYASWMEINYAFHRIYMLMCFALNPLCRQEILNESS